MLLQAGLELTPGIAVVFAVVAAAVVLFVSEAIPSDITALSVLVSLVVLQDYTGVDAEAALSGFASTATITILAMYILSAGVQRTGVVDQLEHVVARYAGDSRGRLLGATVGITGPLAGVVNNTPVVALFIPMITDLADRTHTSPSKFLIPLSYAAMLGGTLTLIGTSTNLLASSVAADLGVAGTPFSMFQFTPLGLLVLAVGSVYLLTVGPLLLPSRIEPHDLTEEFGLGGRLSRVYVPESSSVVGLTPAEARTDAVKILQLLRGGETFVATGSDRAIKAGDVLTIRAEAPAAQSFVDVAGLRRLPQARVTEEELALGSGRGTLAEVIVPSRSGLIGQAVGDARLEERFDATVLAARRGGSLVVQDVADVGLSEGDGLLIYATQSGIDHLEETGELLVTEAVGDGLPEPEPIDWREAGLAIGIVLGVIAVAAADLLAISVAALGGVVAMVLGGIIDPERAYAAVNWEVIFLLAGVIPLGLAMDRTGAAAYLAAHITDVSTVLPAIGTVALFYLLTGLLANLITPVASVALVLPIAVSTAADLGANAFAFVLAVTFAGSTAFMTPMGYQTNLMVYSPGGYRFTDYVRIGAPLQLLLAVVTTLGIAAIWGV
ncbi:SLC13 family permease [Halapricum hydrolyticum]|uniref:SLC13 family permease n=1 Tax=Halapricum hydrolyticum TaxID=2979991 RepID=A0AAE3LEA2_9EURY|nr:SLC13 family permease [Halapricum hydrolyticum]MCU4716680.1 SLC13 family permease [Halapricum hydrolyticum]MCU4725715.1 SLC13 family permease [Halapricum hydrolyticum]